jgi:hypothetical protein
MYDYLSLKSDELYSDYLSPEQFDSYFDNHLDYIKQSRFGYHIKIKNYYCFIQGIHCDSKGNYGFETDKDFKKINLIEINIPQGAESILDEDIRRLAKRIASHFKWQIDWNE